MLIIILLPINATVNSSTGKSNTDNTSGGLVQSPSSNPTATPGVTFDVANVTKTVVFMQVYFEKITIRKACVRKSLAHLKFLVYLCRH